MQNFQAFMDTEPVCPPDEKTLENNVAVTHGLFVLSLSYTVQSSLNITKSSKKMKQTPTTDTPFETQFCFTDSAEVYYQPIDLRSSQHGGYVDAHLRPVSDVEFSNLSKYFPGDIVVDGQIYCDPSTGY